MSLGPNNTKVLSALEEVESGQSGGQLLDLCQRYVNQNDDNAADEMLLLLTDSQVSTSSDVAECLKLILAKPSDKLSAKQDRLIAELIRSNVGARGLLAARFESSSTAFFDDMYDRGDGPIYSLRVIALDPACWKSSDVQAKMKEDLLQLLLAKLMESGGDFDGRALKNIALLLAADAEHLSKLLDEDAFDTILLCLDFRLPEDFKSQATLAASRFLEAQPELGERYFSKFLESKAARRRKDDIVGAFSAAAALFPIVPTITANLFLTDGFLQSLMPLLNSKLKDIETTTSFLKLLNAASMDEACRTAISKHCTDWLSHMVSNGNDEQTATAATVLAKVRTGGIKQEGRDTPAQDTDVTELVDLFKNSLRTSPSASVGTSIEGLAYTSLKPEVKEALSKDGPLLSNLFEHMRQNFSNPEIIVGGLSIVSNLVQYQPALTEEQKKIAELKAYANTTKLPSMSPLNDEQHTTARCTTLIEAGVIPLLIEINKKSRSTSTRQLTSNIVLSLSKNAKMRGKIAQQGAVKILLQILNSADSSASKPPYYFPASHALVRILISTNPNHIFPSSGTPSAVSAIRPLLYLLDEESNTSQPLQQPPTQPSPFVPSSQEPRTLLPTFESLLALTNLASIPPSSSNTDPPSSLLIRLAFPILESNLLSQNTFIQRATVELICNLMTNPLGIEKYAPIPNPSTTPSPPSSFLISSDPDLPKKKNRLHLLLALCDAEDLPTRRGAGGALALLTEYPTIIPLILERERGIKILLGMCGDDESEEVVHRGVVCIRNILCCDQGDEEVGGGGGADVMKKVAEQAKAAVIKEGGIDVLKSCLTQTKNQGVLETGVEALKRLVG